MKYLVVFALIAAVATADFLKPQLVSEEVAQIQEIVAAINSPSTDPATAAALEQLLLQTLGLPATSQPAPIAVGPAVVEEVSPIYAGPAILDFPIPDGGVVTAQPSPVVPPAIVPAPVVAPTPAAAAEAASPLVQIILNINSEAAAAPAPALVSPAPVGAPAVAAPGAVNVAEEAVNIDSIVPSPVSVAEVAPGPVSVVEVAAEPVVVVDTVAPQPTPVVLPAPAQTLPDILN